MGKRTTVVPNPLGDFDGKPVLATGIKITNAGDGLSKALAIDPVIIHHDDKIYVVLETECSNVAFPPVKDTNGVVRLHTLKAGAATIVDAALVADVIEKQKRRLADAAKEEDTMGNQPMFDEDGNPIDPEADVEGGE